MKVFITGGAGFIGSNLVKRLLKENHKIVVYDNFSSGKTSNLSKNKNLKIITGDVLNNNKLEKSIKGFDTVYHFSANADVRKGTQKLDLDLKQETIATHNVLEAMRKNNIKKIVFPSSMTVYGVQNGSISESYGPCLPISLYAACKLSCEAMVSAYSSFGIQSWIFRFGNIVGSPGTHGVVYDLINKLIKNKKELEVLGDGNQNKPYIYIEDALDGMEYVVENAKEKVNLFNLGVDDSASVKEIVKIIISKMKLKDLKVNYQKTQYGWVGDVPKFNLSNNKIEHLGFKPKYSSSNAIALAVSDRLKELNYRNV